jgi:hypothetical protein
LFLLIILAKTTRSEVGKMGKWLNKYFLLNYKNKFKISQYESNGFGGMLKFYIILF